MSPLVDLFVNENGLRVIKAFTPLSRDEFDAIWDRIGVQVITDWRTGRGSRCKRMPNNDFFITLSGCHLSTKWENHGVTFGMTT